MLFEGGFFVFGAVFAPKRSRRRNRDKGNASETNNLIPRIQILGWFWGFSSFFSGGGGADTEVAGRQPNAASPKRPKKGFF